MLECAGNWFKSRTQYDWSPSMHVSLHLKDPKSISSCSKRWLACCDSCWLLRLWWSWDHSPPAIASSSRSGATQPARHCHGVPCCSTPCQVPPLSAALTPRSGASRRPSEEQGDWIEDPFLPFLDEWLLDGSYMVHGWLIVQSQPSESSLWISSETKTMFIEWNHGWLMDSWWFSPCWLTWFFNVFVSVQNPMHSWLTPNVNPGLIKP